MKLNHRDLPYLEKPMLDLIFKHVYDMPTDVRDPFTRDFLIMLKNMQNFNQQYRKEELVRLFPLAEPIVGPFEINSEGTSFWLAMILAIQELYGMRDNTLKGVLHKITVRK